MSGGMILTQSETITINDFSRLKNHISNYISEHEDRLIVVFFISEIKWYYFPGFEAAKERNLVFCPLDNNISLDSHIATLQKFNLPGILISVTGDTKSIRICKKYINRNYPYSTLFENAVLAFMTSGTSGKRKLIFASEENVRASVEAISERLNYGPNDAIGCYLPLSFDYGFYQYILACKLVKARLFLPDSGYNMDIISHLKQQRYNILPIVPSMAANIALLSSRIGVFEHITKITSTGEMFKSQIKVSLARMFPNAEIFSMYGLTECKRVSIGRQLGWINDDNYAGEILSCCDVFIEDPDSGGVGKVVVTGKNVCIGAVIHDDEKFTYQLYRGKLNTGDYGRINQNRELFIHGRKDDLIKLKGIRISILEVENYLTEIDEVAMCRCVYRDGNLQAYIVSSQDVDADVLRKKLFAKFGDHVLSTKFIKVDEIPMTNNLKVRGEFAS